MYCKNCGNEISNTATFCDGCGERIVRDAKSVEQDTPAVTAKPTAVNDESKNYNIFSIIGFSLSMLSLLIPTLYYDTIMVVAVAAIVLGIIGLVKNKNYSPKAINKVFAIIAICVSAYTIIYTQSQWDEFLSIFS